MSEKTKEVKKFQDTMYTLNLHGETIYKYKLLGLFGFMSTFDNQSMSIGCVAKLGHLFGFLRHYLLNVLNVGKKIIDWFSRGPMYIQEDHMVELFLLD